MPHPPQDGINAARLPLSSTTADAAGDFELLTVRSGAQSIRSRRFGETFHPVVGPTEEAELLHVRQNRLLERAAAEPGTFIVWDVGLGAAANAIAALQAFRTLPHPAARIEIHSFDLGSAGLEFALEHTEALPYLEPWKHEAAALVDAGHWSAGEIHWRLHLGDFRETLRDVSIPTPRAILYDPYSPVSNPEVWSLEHFTALHRRLDPAIPCSLTSYSISTGVRVTLLLAGLFVGRGKPIGEKHETTVAATHRHLLDDPLDPTWLGRVHRSRAGAPRRIGHSPAPISEPDWLVLTSHPQFADTRSQ